MNRRKARAVAIACGLLCATCVFVYLQSVKGEADAARAEALARYGGEQLEVCVAKRDIAAGETVEGDAMHMRMWLADLLPQDAVQSMEDVLGRQATSTILAGEVLSFKRFDEQRSELEIPQGLIAVSVPAKDVQAVGGAVVSGSVVDVYASGGVSTEAIARDVLVLATNANKTSTGASEGLAWITMALEPDVVQEVIAASEKTELYFTLPGAGATEGRSASLSHLAESNDVIRRARLEKEGL